MKLQFKEQAFQLDAVQEVMKHSESQTFKTNKFTLERTQEILKKARDKANGIATLELDVEVEIGYRNSASQITDK